jgi:outer membrane protein
MTVRTGLSGLLLACIVFTGIPIAAADLPQAQIGMVIDGPWDRNNEIRAAFEQEILNLTRGEYDVRFPPDKRIEADWSVSGVRAALDQLLADPEVDIVIAAGVLASNEACRRGPPPKPVVAPIVLDPQIQGIPFVKGTSGVKNLVYITFPSDLGRDLEMFQGVVPFTRLAFLTNSVIAEAIPELRENVIRAARDLDIQIRFVPIEPPTGSPLAGLPDDTEAVFVSPLLGYSEDQVDRVISELTTRRLPSFSAVGTREVERGMLVGVAPDFDIPRLARRLGLNIQRILLGEDPSTFQVVFTRGEKLTVNMATARSIGVFPNWKILTEAHLVGEEREEAETARTLSLTGAVREAMAANVDLLVQDRAVSSGSQLVREAKAVLLPQVEVSGQAVAIDEDLGSPQQAERTFSGSTTLSQVVFSESAWANLSIQGHLQRSRVLKRDEVRLDIAQEAATAFLNVLKGKTLERIRRDNVRLSRSHLELAQVRQSIGFSGPGEVYRWESQIATDQKAVISANSQRNLAEMALNRILHRPLEEPFSTVEVGLDDPRIAGPRRWFSYIGNKWDFRVFRSFIVQEGISRSPELKQLDAAIEAQSRVFSSNRRAFFTPTVALQGEATRSFARAGTGSDLPAFGGDSNWSLGINLSLPLFSGGSRFAGARRAQEELWRLRAQRESAAEGIEQRIRSSLHRMAASYAGIQLSRDAAEAARKNQELMRDAYSQGLVSVIELLDAQNVALVSELAAANSVHDFLVDLIEVERSAGQFIFLAEAAEVDAFFDRMDAFFARAEAGAR